MHRTSPQHIASRDSVFVTRTTPSTSLQAHTSPTRASWLALGGPPTASAHGVGWVDQTGAFATISAPHATSPLCNTTHCVSGRSSSSPAPLCQPHRRGTPQLVQAGWPWRWSTCCTSTLRPKWVDQMGVVATTIAPHATSPLCNTSHCLTGCTSSPAPLSQPRHWCTPHPLVRWLALALVHLLHQHTALGGSTKQAPLPPYVLHMPPLHCATPPPASLGAHHHLRHFVNLTAEAHRTQSCELVGAPTHGAPGGSIKWAP